MSEEVPERRSSPALRELVERLEANPFGIITQTGYRELEKKIAKHSEKMEERFHRWFLGGLVAFGIIALTSAGALVGFSVLLTKQGNLTSKIQQQRFDSLLDGCLDQNLRHDDVIKKIDAAVAGTPPPPARQRRAKESAKPFKLILEAAVPHIDDCRQFARSRVNEDQ